MMKNTYTIDENGFEVKVSHSEMLTEHDYEPMIEADYQLRLEVVKAKGQDPSTIKKRTPEQTFNSINRTECVLSTKIPQNYRVEFPTFIVMTKKVEKNPTRSQSGSIFLSCNQTDNLWD